MKKKRIYSAVFAAPVVLLTSELYRYVFRRKGSPLLNPILDKKGHAEDYYIHRDSAAEQLRAQPRRRYTLGSARGDKLCAYYYPAGGEGKRIAFIIHGYRSEHAETAGMFYEYYKSRGFDLFCCDHTASGESGGGNIGFDVYESEDCLKWLYFLLNEFGYDVQIILHGFSMGGATVLKMSDRCPDNVKFIVSDSGYIDAREQLKGRLGPLYHPLRLINCFFAGYDMAETDVRPSLSSSRVPILFVHGTEDRTVYFENGQRLYDMYEGEKDFLFVPSARHVESMHMAPELYAEKLDGFIEKYIE